MEDDGSLEDSVDPSKQDPPPFSNPYQAPSTDSGELGASEEELLGDYLLQRSPYPGEPVASLDGEIRFSVAEAVARVPPSQRSERRRQLIATLEEPSAILSSPPNFDGEVFTYISIPGVSTSHVGVVHVARTDHAINLVLQVMWRMEDLDPQSRGLPANWQDYDEVLWRLTKPK